MSKADKKRARLPRVVDYSKFFAKDWERLNHSGRYNMNNLKSVMLKIIANDEPLGAEYKDHALVGDWEGCRECHIGGDFLLIYKLFGDGSIVVFVRSGTHSELFK